jgi:WD40 repeat protein
VRPGCSPDGKTAAFFLGDTVVLYDLEKKAETRRWTETKMRELRFSPDGKQLTAWSLRGLRLWDVATGEQGFAWDRLVDSPVVFSKGGKRLAWTGYDERSIPYPWVVDLGEGPPRRLGLPINNLGSHLAFSPDGDTLAVNSDAGALELRDVATGKDAFPLDANTGRVFGLQLTPDGRYLATFDTFRVLVWEMATGKLLRRFPEGPPGANERSHVWDVRLTAEGQLKRGNDNSLYSHWAEIGPPALERIQKLQLKDGVGGGPAFAAFEGTIADVLESRGARLLAVRLSGQRPGVIDRMARIAIRVWDTRTGEPLDALRPPDGQVLGAFSPDDRLLVTTSQQGVIHVWDLATGQERLRLKGHLPGAVRSVLFTPDSRFLLSGGDDSQVFLWDLTGRSPDGTWRTVRHEPKQQQALWDKLAAADGAVAHKALWELAADPEGTVTFLQARLKPIAGPDEKAVAELIVQLGSDTFDVRHAAQTRLTKIGEPAVPPLRKALAKAPPLEHARRLEKLLQELTPPAPTGDILRSHRGLEVLERIGTPEARRLLGELAKGFAGLRFTEAARESLRRLENPQP